MIPHFEPGKNSLPQLNAVVDAANQSTQQVRRLWGESQRTHNRRGGFPIRITGAGTGGSNSYAYTALWADLDGSGLPKAAPAAMGYTLPANAIEINGRPDIAAGLTTWAFLEWGPGDVPVLMFAAAGVLEFAVVVSVVEQAAPYYSWLTAHPCVGPQGYGVNAAIVWRVDAGILNLAVRTLNVGVGAVIAVCYGTGMGGGAGEVGGFWCLSDVYDAPHGTIRMDSAAYAAAVPTGWALCDGTNGTPDLRDKFPMGLGGALGPTGGAQSHTHNAHANNVRVTTGPTGSDVVSFPADHNAADHLPPYRTLRFLMRL